MINSTDRMSIVHVMLHDNEDEHVHIITPIPDYNIPQPCYYMLRLLAVWQPTNAHWILKLYNRLGYVIALAVVTGVLYTLNMKPSEEGWIAWLNNIATLTTLGLPFFLLKWFMYSYKYNEFMSALKEESEIKYEKCKIISMRYSFIAFILWMFGCAAGLLMFLSLLNEPWLYSTMAVLLVYGNGWWACWLTIYGNICHIHLDEVRDFKDCLKRVESKRCDNTVEELVIRFKELKLKLTTSQEKLHKLISIPVALHLFDMTVYTVAYFEGDYEGEAGILKYSAIPFILGMSVDCVSVLIKLIPAAIVSYAIHQVVVTAADLCIVDKNGVMDEKYFTLHQYIYMCEEDMGYKILGVKISVKLMLTLLIAFMSLVTGILKYVGN